MQVIECVPNQQLGVVERFGLGSTKTVAEQVHRADFLLEPEQLRGQLSPYPQAWVPQKYEPKES